MCSFCSYEDIVWRNASGDRGLISLSWLISTIQEQEEKEDEDMRKGHVRLMIVVMTLTLAVPTYALVSSDSAEKFSSVLMKAPAANHWQVMADEVYG